MRGRGREVEWEGVGRAEGKGCGGEEGVKGGRGFPQRWLKTCKARLEFWPYAPCALRMRIQARIWLKPSPDLMAGEEGVCPPIFKRQPCRHTLANITWPNCFSRAIVQPDDALLAHGFPLGMVNNYCTGLRVSLCTKAWPNLTKLLNTLGRFLASLASFVCWKLIQGSNTQSQ